MNAFEIKLRELCDEAEEIQRNELETQAKARIHTQKLMTFLKEQGLPENFTVPQLALLAVKKCRVEVEVLPPEVVPSRPEDAV